MSQRVKLALWCLGIVITMFGLVAGGVVLHHVFVGQSQYQVRHSLRHLCHENTAFC